MNIKKRNIVTAIILSIITCGIYMIYWAIMLAKEAVSVNDSNDNGLVEILLMIFLPFLGFFLAEQKLAKGCAAKGIAHNDNSILYLILGIVGLSIVNFAMMQNDLNKIVDATAEVVIPAQAEEVKVEEDAQ
ncbi:MAG: DUF4234 domain-containing protein [Clostridia bacterium]|nr:DUF4234 domain-containing protein [Clostridia bacterium]